MALQEKAPQAKAPQASGKGFGGNAMPPMGSGETPAVAAGAATEISRPLPTVDRLAGVIPPSQQHQARSEQHHEISFLNVPHFTQNFLLERSAVF